MIEGYRHFQLKNLGEFKNGANYPKGSYGKGDKIVNVKDLFRGRFVNEKNLVELKPDALKDKSIYTVKDNDLLFTRSSMVKSGAGMVAMMQNPSDDVLFCGFIIRYRITDEKTNPLYMLYLLRSPMYRKLFTGGSVQTNISNINQESLGNIDVYLPSIKRQNKIAKILSDLDAKIELNNKINSELEGMAKLLYDYWFVQFDFPISEEQAKAMGKPELKGRPYKSSGGKMVHNQQLKREIPEGWEVKELGAVADFKNGKGIKKDRIIENGGSVIFGSNGPTGKTNDVLFEKSVIAIGRVGVNYGEVNYSLKPCWITDNAVTSQPIEDYYFWWLLSCLKQIDYKSIAGGSAQPLITQGKLKALLFPIPDLKTIQSFHKITNTVFLKIENINDQNQKLSELRDWLLPMLMNGQVTVSETGYLGFKDGQDLSVAAEPEVDYNKQP